MKNVNATVISNTSAASRNSSQIDASQLYQASFQTIFAQSDVTGTVKIQMSNDLMPSGMANTAFTVTNWSDIPNATATITAGVVAPIILSVVSARWLRVVFTRSGGSTGAVTCNMFGICV